MGALIQIQNHLPTEQEIFAAKVSEVAAEVVRLRMLGVEVGLEVTSFVIYFSIEARVRDLPICRFDFFGTAKSTSIRRSFSADHFCYSYFQDDVWLHDPDMDLDTTKPDLWLTKLKEVSDNIDCFITKQVKPPQTSDLFHQAGA